MNLQLERYRFLSTDKITGRTFKLCAEGETEDSAAEKVWQLGFLISGAEPCPWIPDPTLMPKSKFVGEEFVKDTEHLEGKVRSAVLRNEYSGLIQEINTECNLIERHFLLNGLVSLTERQASPDGIMPCELFCWQWFVERQEIVSYMVPLRPENDPQGMMYQVAAVNRLRIIHEGERKAQICEYATDLPYPLPEHQWLVKKIAEYRDQPD